MRTERIIILALVIGLIASVSTASKPQSRRYINLPRPSGASTKPPFSDAVLVGNTLYISGHIGLDPKTGKPAESAQDEARLALDGIQTVLKEAGMSMHDLVYVQVYCNDVSNFDQFNSVYRGYFKGDYPARAFLGSGKLLFNARFEVQAIAVKN